jgi:hypothetical protein
MANFWQNKAASKGDISSDQKGMQRQSIKVISYPG